MQETAVNIIVALLLAQQKGEITAQEQAELNEWINASEDNRQFAERCLDQEQVATSLAAVAAIDEQLGWQRFMEKNGIEQAAVVPIRKKIFRWMVAAVLVGILGTGAYLWLIKTTPQATPEAITTHKGENIKPGTNQATLVLSDGRSISLNDSKNGVLAEEGGVAVHKQGEELIYNPENHTGKASANKSILYHTVTTPRGGQYALILPDQTKVWLNAEASIRYPTIFGGKERRVELNGEAYFEVAPKAHQPFVVMANPIQVKVLGTHFNIRAYADENATSMTLLEGKVQVSLPETVHPTSSAVLQPNEQAIIPRSLSSQPPIIPVQAVDVESVVAWKNGYFDFKAIPFADIMKELKRWYADVDAITIKEPMNDRLTATIPRNVPLSTMLTILEATGKVHFEVKNKTVIVTR